MEILLWLLPAVVATLASMAWVGWLGRTQRTIDREESARRLGAALARAEKRGVAEPGRRTPERGTGVALRASRPRPTVIVGEGLEDDVVEGVRIVEDESAADERDRRAS